MCATPAAVLLLSQSPRRKELLQSAGLVVHAWPTHAAEDASAATPELQAVAIARQKMAAFDQQLTGSKKHDAPSTAELELTRIAADTLVVLGETRLGKPADAAAARSMLQALSGASHRVITGVVLRLGASEQAFAVTTHVRFRPLTPAEVHAYVATGEPFDKAGGYGIQGLGGHLVQEVQGSLTNVIGLPLAETLQALQQLHHRPKNP